LRTGELVHKSSYERVKERKSTKSAELISFPVLPGAPVSDSAVDDRFASPDQGMVRPKICGRGGSVPIPWFRFGQLTHEGGDQDIPADIIRPLEDDDDALALFRLAIDHEPGEAKALWPLGKDDLVARPGDDTDRVTDGVAKLDYLLEKVALARADFSQCLRQNRDNILVEVGVMPVVDRLATP